MDKLDYIFDEPLPLPVSGKLLALFTETNDTLAQLPWSIYDLGGVRTKLPDGRWRDIYTGKIVSGWQDDEE